MIIDQQPASGYGDPAPSDRAVGPSGSVHPAKDDESNEALAQRAEVKRWGKRITKAEAKWEPDFKRMKNNQKFVTGIQWDGQKSLVAEDRYINNITLRVIGQKTASLYARNPQVDSIRREKLDFSVWDGDRQSLIGAVGMAGMAVQGGMQAPPEAMAVINDYQRGMSHRKMIQRICDTLRLTYQYQVDSSRPEFKEQMKQLVTRVITCGVGYCRPIFYRENQDEGMLKTTEIPHSVMDRAKRAQIILKRLEEKEIEEDDAQVATLKSLFNSMGASQTMGDETMLAERIEFDFPPATSVLPDSNCRSLMEFVGAPAIYIRYVIALEEANAFFGTEIKSGSSEGLATVYNKEGEEQTVKGDDIKDVEMEPMVCLYEILDYKTKTHSVICKGWKDYVLPPEPLHPPVTGFWPLFALTFNRIEVEPGSEASIFPPSDVDLIRSAQKEWNRTREALRDQRNANAPKYPVRKGSLTDNDKRAIQDAEPNQVIELEGIPPDGKPADFIQPMQVAGIDQAVYDTKPLAEDIQYSVGTQEANIGPAQPNVTATVGTIAEQSRMTTSSSNVDDLDGFLSRVARASGEMLIREMSLQTVQRIVGPGAVWPTVNRQDFVNEVELRIVAASSGRPNKAVDTANFERVAPLLMQAGANPIALIREGVKRMDDRLTVEDFFPVPGLSVPQPNQQAVGAGASANPQGQSAGPNQPLQAMPSEAPVPLAGAQ